MTSPSCAFCRSLCEHDVDLVARGDLTVTILDRAPINRGHMLVIPTRHAVTLLDTSEDEVAELAVDAQRAARALLEVMGMEATTLLMSNGEVADQDIPHAHLHVIPRLPGDNLEMREDASRYPHVPLTDAEKADLRSAVAGERSHRR